MGPSLSRKKVKKQKIEEKVTLMKELVYTTVTWVLYDLMLLSDTSIYVIVQLLLVERWWSYNQVAALRWVIYPKNKIKEE